MSAGYQAEYKAKLCAPAEAVRFARSGSNISMGMALGEPPALLAALNEKIEAGNLTDIRTEGKTRFVQPRKYHIKA